LISRFRRGAIRACLDIQIPEGFAEGPVVQKAKSLVKGLYDQHRAIILQQPEFFGIKEDKGGDWRFLKVKFRIWPGQGSLIENTFRQRVIPLMKNLYPDYAEWMITVTYRVE
jgi:small conductance mechanosensitive channel